MENEFLPKGIKSMLTLSLTGGSLVIDDKDLDLYLKYNWRIIYKSYGDRKYCKAKDVGLFHRLVLNAKEGDIIDHINGNGLDNRRENLRVISNRENSQNSYLRREGKTLSVYIGVTKSKYRWRVRYWTKITGHVCIGSYSTQEAAAKAYDMYVINNVEKVNWGTLNITLNPNLY